MSCDLDVLCVFAVNQTPAPSTGWILGCAQALSPHSLWAVLRLTVAPSVCLTLPVICLTSLCLCVEGSVRMERFPKVSESFLCVHLLWCG